MWEDKKKGLKPCPFCGGEAVLRGSPYVGWIAFCERCAIFFEDLFSERKGYRSLEQEKQG